LFCNTEHKHAAGTFYFVTAVIYTCKSLIELTQELFSQLCHSSVTTITHKMENINQSFVGNLNKTYLSLVISQNKPSVLVSFQPCLTFVGEAGANQSGSCLVLSVNTMLEDTLETYKQILSLML